MYFAISRYGETISSRLFYPILCTKIYILDTSDWTVEFVSVSDIESLGIHVENIIINDNSFRVVNHDFVIAMRNANLLNCVKKRSLVSGIDTGNCTYFASYTGREFAFNIGGIRLILRIDIKEIDKDTGIAEETLYVNDKEILDVLGSVEFSYVFKFRDYAVLRFVSFQRFGKVLARWHSVAVGINGDIHYWVHGECNDELSVKIDTISEV